VLVGSSIAAFGFGLTFVSLYWGRFPGLMTGIPVFLIGLFGLNWVIQGLRGRSRHNGIFYVVLGWLIRLGPRVWSLFIPTLALLNLLVGALTNDREALDFSLKALVGWLAFMANIAVHEAGHFAAARVMRLPVGRMIIGPLEMTKEGSGWSLDLSREWISIFGGFVQIKSPLESLSPRQLLVFALGGPAATALLLGAFLAFSPFDLPGLLRSSPDTLQHGVLSMGAEVAILILVLNLIPLRQLAFGHPSDGYQILMAIRRMRGRRTGR